MDSVNGQYKRARTGMHCVGVDKNWDKPRTPFGPSLIRTLGISRRSMLEVFHQFLPAKRDIFSLMSSLSTKSSIDCSKKERLMFQECKEDGVRVIDGIRGRRNPSSSESDTPR